MNAMMHLAAAAVLALLLPLVAAAAPLADELRAAERLAWQKRFVEAERQYRDILRRHPDSRAAALGLAQVLLWETRYADAAAAYRALLRHSPNDVDARKGLATAEYWSGDFRAARRDYEAVLRVRPNDADARQALSDITAATAPLLSGEGEYVHDDQPLDRARVAAGYTFFTDPLTKWSATAGTYALSTRGFAFGEATAPFGSIGASTWLPSTHLRVSGSLRMMRFPDGVTKGLGGVAVAREWPHAALRLEVDQHELLYAASSMQSHPSETTTTLGWTRGTEGSSSAVGLHAIRYFDHNAGRAADGYHLMRVAHSSRASLSAGAAVSYRDTDESRFRLIGPSSSPLPGGGFAYSYAARYDPYWTPRALTEARAIVAANVSAGRAAIRLHADGGVGRDRDRIFGPSSGSSPFVPLFPRPVEVSRTFHPWRASADVTFPLRGTFTATAGFEHQVTAFYRADAIHFGFSGRL
ncbi:MAG: Tetratricopeptide repeat [Acidobacteriota bacterium]|jgi:tetratricopeptide (TPR) repeat protein|nr:Tetratricopeptide repeat [Acidobacteriota bacterium]